MRHVPALMIKTLMVTAVLLVILSMFNDYPVGSTIVLSLFVVGVSYLIGDLFILPATNNTLATLADIGLCTLKIWLLGPFIVAQFIPFSLALLSAVVIGVGEWFFHKYMSHAVLEGHQETQPS